MNDRFIMTDAMNGIDGKIMERYFEVERKTEKKAERSWVKWEIAACLMLAAAIGAMLALTGLKTPAGPPDMSLVVWGSPVSSGIDLFPALDEFGHVQPYFGKVVTKELYDVLSGMEEDKNAFLAMSIGTSGNTDLEEWKELLDKNRIYYEVRDPQKMYHDAGIYGEFVDAMSQTIILLPTLRQFKLLELNEKQALDMLFCFVTEEDYNRRTIERPERTKASDWEGIKVEKLMMELFDKETWIHSFESTEQLYNAWEHLKDRFAGTKLEVGIKIYLVNSDGKDILNDLPDYCTIKYSNTQIIRVNLMVNDMKPELIYWLTNSENVMNVFFIHPDY